MLAPEWEEIPENTGELKPKPTKYHIRCLECGSEALLVDSSVVYGRSYGDIFVCSRYPECDSYVGTHKKSGKPLGYPAGPKTRALRKKCHELFDPLWRQNKIYKIWPGKTRGGTRRKAYIWLAKRLKIPEKDCHIGLFDEKMCKKALNILIYT